MSYSPIETFQQVEDAVKHAEKVLGAVKQAVKDARRSAPAAAKAVVQMLEPAASALRDLPMPGEEPRVTRG